MHYLSHLRDSPRKRSQPSIVRNSLVLKLAHYTYIYLFMYICMYAYIERKRERERDYIDTYCTCGMVPESAPSPAS